MHRDLLLDSMPIYSYRCTSCGNFQDILQKISDATLDTCPVCGAATFKKQVTAAGFQLKGSGWYVTDFRNPAPKPATGKADQAADQGASGAADSSTSDKAPAATTDANATRPAPAAADSGGATPSKATASPAPASGNASSVAK